MPRRLELYTIHDAIKALLRRVAKLGGLGVRVEKRARVRVGGERGDGLFLLGGGAVADDRVEVFVAGDGFQNFVAKAREHVDDAAGQVAVVEDFGEVDGQGRGVVFDDDHGGIARDDDRGERGDEPEERGVIRREDGDYAGGLGGGDIEVRRGDR